MEDDEMMPTNNIIKEELLEILNRSEFLSSFNEVLQKHGILANKTMAIEFKFFETTELQIDDASPENFSTLSAPLAPDLLLFGLTWCPSPPCPFPGRWVG